MLIEEQAPADPHDPGGIAALAAKRRRALPGANKGFLRQIIGVAWSREPRKEGAQPRLVSQDQKLECTAIPPGDPLVEGVILIVAQRPVPLRPPRAPDGDG